MRAIAAEIKEKFGGMGVVFANAGWACPSAVNDIDDNTLQRDCGHQRQGRGVHASSGAAGLARGFLSHPQYIVRGGFQSGPTWLRTRTGRSARRNDLDRLCGMQSDRSWNLSSASPLRGAIIGRPPPDVVGGSRPASGLSISRNRVAGMRRRIQPATHPRSEPGSHAGDTRDTRLSTRRPPQHGDLVMRAQ